MAVEHLSLTHLREITRPVENDRKVVLTPDHDGIIAETASGIRFGVRIYNVRSKSVGTWILSAKNQPIIFSESPAQFKDDNTIGAKSVLFFLDRRHAYISEEIELYCEDFNHYQVTFKISSTKPIVNIAPVSSGQDMKHLLEQKSV